MALQKPQYQGIPVIAGLIKDIHHVLLVVGIHVELLQKGEEGLVIVSVLVGNEPSAWFEVGDSTLACHALTSASL